ncbi:MAG: aromatic amino acid lyase [Myxococcota bacterium]
MSESIEVKGQGLSLAHLVEVARCWRSAHLAPDAKARMARSRAVVERLLEERVKVYGLTTGFGSKKNVFIEPAETRRLQRNLIRSHSCGVGEPLAEDVTRATILLRANTLALGMSGVRVTVVEALLRLLELRIVPFIPSKGSLGASGDLAPLSHLALVLAGEPEGKIVDPARLKQGQLVERPEPDAFVPSTPERLRSLGFEPVSLEAKEGLALNNGTQVMTAIGLLTIHDARRLILTAEGACAMSYDALKAVLHALDPRLHAARPHPGQQETALNLRRFTRGSQILRLPLNMAYINASKRSLNEALFHLGEQDSPLVDDIAERIRRVLASIEELRREPEAPLDYSPRSDVGDLEAYRAVLARPKQELSDTYRSLLSSRFVGDVHLAQRALSDGLASLEAAVPVMPPVQDNYSLRCAPQVVGAVRQVVDHVEQVLLTEANSATDNPLILPPVVDVHGEPLPLDDVEAYQKALDMSLCRSCVRSGGNFHGEPVAMAMDYLAIGLSELGNISERRVAHMVDGHLNQGLPSLLIHHAGLNSGFMIPQYTAAALVSENKSMAHPASVDSIPSCENTEDHVSMGTIAARKARQILRCSEEIVAIELLTAYQALHFRQPLAPGLASRWLQGLLEAHGVTFVEEDRALHGDIAQVVALIRAGVPTEVLLGLSEGVLDDQEEP